MVPATVARFVTIGLAFGMMACLLPSGRAAADSGLPSFCSDPTADVLADALVAGVSLAACPIVGETVSAPTLALGVPVPASGTSVALGTDTTGEEELWVTTDGLTIQAGWSVVQASASNSDGSDGATNPTSTDVADSSRCDSPNDYNIETSTWNVGASPHWYYNSSTVSRAGLNVASSLGDIRAGNQHMSEGDNACGKPNSGFNIAAYYQGDTSKYANVNSQGNCTGNFPDGQNTDSWGPFDSSIPNRLAETCYHYNLNGKTTEGDTYFGSNRYIYDSLPSVCYNDYDLQSIATHEWGHFFGLAHASGKGEVMYPTISACSTSHRSLGLGDYDGMAHIYQFR